jgi:hypothetical protein
MATDIHITGEERNFLLDATDPKTDPMLAPNKLLHSLTRKGVLKHRIDLTPLGQTITEELRQKYRQIKIPA